MTPLSSVQLAELKESLAVRMEECRASFVHSVLRDMGKPDAQKQNEQTPSFSLLIPKRSQWFRAYVPSLGMRDWVAHGDIRSAEGKIFVRAGVEEDKNPFWIDAKDIVALGPTYAGEVMVPRF